MKKWPGDKIRHGREGATGHRAGTGSLAGEDTTYCCFYYFTSNLSTAKFCSRPVKVCSQSLGRESSPGSNRSRDICENIRFSHAVGGCNTTSSLFSVGKGSPMQKLKKSPLFRNHPKVFTTKSNSQERKNNNSNKSITAGGRGSSSVVWRNYCMDDSAWTRFHLTSRHQNYSICASVEEPCKTSPAAKCHSLRTWF